MATSRIVRWSLRTAPFILLAGAALFVVRQCQISAAPTTRTESSAWSPDHAFIAETRTEESWTDVDEYVVIRRAEEQSFDKPMVVLEARGGPGLLIRWRGKHDLDIGFPVRSNPNILASEKEGVRLRMVPYPDQPTIHAEFLRLQKEFEDPKASASFPIGHMIDFQRSPTLIEALASTANPQRVGMVSYESTQSREFAYRICALGFSFDGGLSAAKINAALQADVDTKRDFVDFSLRLGVQGVRDPNLSRLTMTGAQFVGEGFATSMAEAASVSNQEPVAEDTFRIDLFRQRDLEQLLAALDHPPFKLAFLWDLPDTVVAYEIGQSPPRDQLASFFQCVGDAKPAHLQGEEFRPFYRADK